MSATSPQVAFDSPDDERLVELGTLKVDASGNGELTFIVPDVPPGSYTTITRCVPLRAVLGGSRAASDGADKATPGWRRGPSGSARVLLVGVALVAGGLLILGSAALLRRRGLADPAPRSYRS